MCHARRKPTIGRRAHYDPKRQRRNEMKTKLFLLAAAIAAVGALSGPAVAATGHAPVLDREQLTTWYGNARIACHWDSTRSTLTVDYGLSGVGTLPYTGNFGMSGTATFA